MAVEVTMPKFGLTMHEGTLQRYFKAAGEAVKAGEPLYEVETEKVLYEVESPTSGTLAVWLHEEGATVECGLLVAVIAEAGDDAASLAARYDGGAAAHSAAAPPSSPAAPASRSPLAAAAPDGAAAANGERDADAAGDDDGGAAARCAAAPPSYRAASDAASSPASAITATSKPHSTVAPSSCSQRASVPEVGLSTSYSTFSVSTS